MQRHLYSTINLTHIWIIVFASYRQTMSFLDLVVFMAFYVGLCFVSAMIVKLLTRCHKGTEIPANRFRYVMPSVLVAAAVLSVLSMLMPSTRVCITFLGPVSVVVAVVVGWLAVRTKGKKKKQAESQLPSNNPVQ